MTVFLVRHAQAGSRRESAMPDDRLRPLTPEGRLQAAAIVGVLADLGVTAVRSSPYRRCVQSAVPLAAHLDVPVLIDEVLEEGPSDAALSLVRRLAQPTVSGHEALFSHGDIIPGVLDALARLDGLDLGRDPRCQKASIWILEPSADGSRFVSAAYVPPPRWGKN